MSHHGLCLSLAVRASPNSHGGAVPSNSLILNPHVGAGSLQIQLAVQCAAAPTICSSDATVLQTPVVSPTPVEPVLAASELTASPANDAEALPGGPASEPTVVTAIALTPQAEAYIDGQIEERIREAVSDLCDYTLDDLIEGKLDDKISDAVNEHAETLERLESRLDDLEEREGTGIDEDVFEDMRLDLRTLSRQVDQLTGLRDTVAELTDACAALRARVAQLEQLLRGGETSMDGEGRQA